MSSRRRRKSQNRHVEKKRPVKWVALGGVTFLVLLVLGIVFGYNAVRSYLRSDDFRVMLGSQAGGFLEGEADFSPFEWDGWSVSTDEFIFQGEDGLQNLNARGIDAEVDIGAIWSRTYRIEDIRLREVELIGDFRKKPSADAEEPGLIPVDQATSEASGGFWNRFLPNSLELTGLDIATINGRAVTDDGIWFWRDMTAQVRPGSAKNAYDLELTGGDITTPLSLVDQLELRTLKGRYSGDHFYLLSSEFDALKSARVTMKGDFGLKSRVWAMHGDVTGARVEELIAEDWRRRLMGPLVLDFTVNGRPDSEARMKGEIFIKDGVLTALPVLDRIAAYANTSRFRRLSLSEAELTFEKVGGSLELNDIVLESKGLVRLEGAMRLDGNIIRKGDFRVGITPGTLAHIPGAETKVFQRGKLGLLWTPMVISGTIDSPQEDLSERLIAAASERMFELVPETGQFALKYSGKVIGESTRAILENQGVILGAGQAIVSEAASLIEGQTGVDAGNVIETGKEVLGEGGKAIEGGVEKLFDLFGGAIGEGE